MVKVTVRVKKREINTIPMFSINDTVDYSAVIALLEKNISNVKKMIGDTRLWN